MLRLRYCLLALIIGMVVPGYMGYAIRGSVILAQCTRTGATIGTSRILY